jgi:hypothetical protein
METFAEIYIRLLGEGVDAYRPVPAEYVDGFLFEVLKPSDYVRPMRFGSFHPVRWCGVKNAGLPEEAF